MSHHSDASFPEAIPWTGDDTRPMPSSRGKSDQRGADRRTFKRALHVLLKAYGTEWVQRVVDESVKEHPDAKFTAWVDEQDQQR